MSLAGGLIGLILGLTASFVRTGLMDWPMVISPAAILAVCGVVSVFFGYYPAWKASRLEPIEALRHE